MHTKDFKVLCERFAIAYNPLHNSRKDGLLSQEKFKEICKSIAQQLADDVPAPCPTDSTRVRIPEGISPGDRFKSEWDGLWLKCPEGKAAGDEMEVDVPTAAHRSRIKELASRALDELPKPFLEKKRKHDLGPSEVQPPLPAPPPPAAPHLTAPPLPDQGAGTPLAVPPAAPQLDLGQGSSALTPLLQLLEGNRAFVQSNLAAGSIPTVEQLHSWLQTLVKELGPIVRKSPVAVEDTLKAGLASLGWDAIDNKPAPEASPPTPEAVLAFLEESLAKLGPAPAEHSPDLAPTPAPKDSQLEGASLAGGAALGPLYPAGAAPMALQSVAAPEFERPQLARGTLGTPVRLATNLTTLNIAGGQEVFKYFVSWWDTEDDARDSVEGAEARHEAKLPLQKRKQAYGEVLPQLLRRFSARIATDGDKMLVCAMQLPPQADGPIVLYSEAARVFMRIQPSSVSRQALAAPGGQPCIDIILGHPGRMLRKAVGLALFNEEESTHIKLSESKEMWLGTRQSVLQSASGKQLLAVDVAVTTMVRQIDVHTFLVEELRKTGSRSIRREDDLAHELQRSQALRNTVESQLKNTQVTHTYGPWRERNAEHEKLTALTRQGLSARQARAQLRPDDPSPSSRAIKTSRPIKGLGKPPGEMSFTEEATGRTWTVLEWFAEEERVSLRHPHLPCLLFGKDGRNAVPMELCRFAGGNKSGVLTAEERREVVAKTSEAPSLRKQKCDTLLESIKRECDECDSGYLQSFGIDFGARLQLDGRKLRAMEVKFGNGTTTPDTNGAWNPFKGSREFTFIKPATIDRVVVLEFCAHAPLHDLFQTLHSVAGERGIRLAGERGMLPDCFVPLRHHVPPSLDKLDTFMDKELGQHGRGLGHKDLLFIVLPEKRDRDGPLYEKVKGWCLARGLPLQCLLISTIKSQVDGGNSRLKGYVNNLLLKINEKMGGVNWLPHGNGLQLLRDTATLVVGLDVHHPRPGVDGPSYLGLTSFFFGRDANGRDVQHVFNEGGKHAGVRKRQEIVPETQLQPMVVELLHRFYKVNGMPPQRVLFYRDGVGDSQFGDVMHHEVGAIRAAFESVRLRTQLVFLVAQKRNPTRFFALDRDRPVDRDGQQRVPPGQNGAPRPGTVVDSLEICSTQSDFYMQGAHALKGTPHPVHYHVLVNDANLGADELQRVTFDFCHMFGRCTKSVSLPSILQWADVAAEKASFLDTNYRDHTGWETSSISSGSNAGPSAADETRHVDGALRPTNWFA